MSEDKEQDERKAQREDVLSEVEFHVDSEVIQAMTVDVSETGVRFDMGKPIKARMRFTVGDEVVDRKAQLVWSQRTPDGGMAYGFEFISGEGKN